MVRESPVEGVPRAAVSCRPVGGLAEATAIRAARPGRGPPEPPGRSGGPLAGPFCWDRSPEMGLVPIFCFRGGWRPDEGQAVRPAGAGGVGSRLRAARRRDRTRPVAVRWCGSTSTAPTAARSGSTTASGPAARSARRSRRRIRSATTTSSRCRRPVSTGRCGPRRISSVSPAARRASNWRCRSKGGGASRAGSGRSSDGMVTIEVDRKEWKLPLAGISKATIGRLIMNKQILEVVEAVSNEKGVAREIIFEALEAALASATRKQARRRHRRARRDRPQDRRVRDLPPLEGVRGRFQGARVPRARAPPDDALDVDADGRDRRLHRSADGIGRVRPHRRADRQAGHRAEGARSRARAGRGRVQGPRRRAGHRHRQARRARRRLSSTSAATPRPSSRAST